MFTRLRKYFISGLVVFLPVALTIYLFFLAIDVAEKFLGNYIQPYIDETFRFYFPGLSILIGLGIIVLIGFFATNFFGRKIYNFFERLLVKLPFFKQVYPALKEMAIFLFSTEKLSRFRKVVIVEYPRKGLYAIGFLTNDTSQRICQKTRHSDLCNIFVPSAPGPLTGYVILIPKHDVIDTDISIEEAFKFIVSGGVVNPALPRPGP